MAAPLGFALDGDAPEGDGFADVAARDRAGAVEVGDGAGDAKDPVIASGGEVQALGRAQQKLAALVVEHGDAIQKFAFGFGVGAYPGCRQLGETLRLDVSRAGNPLGNHRPLFAGRGLGHLLRGKRRHVDMEIDAVEHRARNAALIVPAAARRLRAGE